MDEITEIKQMDERRVLVVVATAIAAMVIALIIGVTVYNIAWMREGYCTVLLANGTTVSQKCDAIRKEAQ